MTNCHTIIDGLLSTLLRTRGAMQNADLLDTYCDVALQILQFMHSEYTNNQMKQMQSQGHRPFEVSVNVINILIFSSASCLFLFLNSSAIVLKVMFPSSCAVMVCSQT